MKLPALSGFTPHFWLSQIVVVRNEEGESARQGKAGDFSEHSLPNQLRQPFSKRIFPSFGRSSQLPCSLGAKKRDKVASSDRFGENWAVGASQDWARGQDLTSRSILLAPWPATYQQMREWTSRFGGRTSREKCSGRGVNKISLRKRISQSRRLSK